MKNWFVEAQQKRLNSEASARTKRRNKAEGKSSSGKKKNTIENAIRYLLEKKYASHFYTEITDLNNAKDTLTLIKRECKGKGLKNAATSLVLSIPADLYHPSTEEWNDIYENMLELLAKKYNKDQANQLKKLLKAEENGTLTKTQERDFEVQKARYSHRVDAETLKKYSTSVIHDERAKPLVVGDTTGSHLNFVISNVINDQAVKYFTQNHGIDAVKQCYSKSVKKVLGLDCKKYIPYEDRLEAEKINNFYTGDNPKNLELIDCADKPHKDLLKNERAKQRVIDKLLDEGLPNPDVENAPEWVKRREKELLQLEHAKTLKSQRDTLQKQKEVVKNQHAKNVSNAKNINKKANKKAEEIAQPVIDKYQKRLDDLPSADAVIKAKEIIALRTATEEPRTIFNDYFTKLRSGVKEALPELLLKFFRALRKDTPNGVFTKQEYKTIKECDSMLKNTNNKNQRESFIGDLSGYYKNRKIDLRSEIKRHDEIEENNRQLEIEREERIAERMKQQNKKELSFVEEQKNDKPKQQKRKILKNPFRN